MYCLNNIENILCLVATEYQYHQVLGSTSMFAAGGNGYHLVDQFPDAPYQQYAQVDQPSIPNTGGNEESLKPPSKNASSKNIDGNHQSRIIECRFDKFVCR